MANQEPVSAAHQPMGSGRDPLPALMRFVFAVPLAVILGFIALGALSWTGWGAETEPMDQRATTSKGASWSTNQGEN